MDKETANYIIEYFPELMNATEKSALKHYNSTIKTEDDPDGSRTRIYYRKGWLTDDPITLELLKSGIDSFKITTATRMLNENGNSINFNLCPNCSKLARTPKAKQCRHCNTDWH